MSTFTLAPRHWISSGFSVTDGDDRVAEFKLSSWREKGIVSVDSIDYNLYRESLLGDFILQRAGAVIARASKPSTFRRSFVIRYRERQYTLRPKSAFTQAFVVLDGSAQIGTLAPQRWFSRKAKVTLPDDWPLPLKMFAMWLAIVLWNRDAAAA
jgi:hypothetical protein